MSHLVLLPSSLEIQVILFMVHGCLLVLRFYLYRTRWRLRTLSTPETTSLENATNAVLAGLVDRDALFELANLLHGGSLGLVLQWIERHLLLHVVAASAHPIQYCMVLARVDTGSWKCDLKFSSLLRAQPIRSYPLW